MRGDRGGSGRHAFFYELLGVDVAGRKDGVF